MSGYSYRQMNNKVGADKQERGRYQPPGNACARALLQNSAEDTSYSWWLLVVDGIPAIEPNSERR
jgi:hypothetical protein